MLNRKSLIYLFNHEVLLQSHIQFVILNVLQKKGCRWQMCILMAKKSRFDGLRKKQSQIDAYYEKIKEIEQQKKDLENEFALKVGQLVLKGLKNDVDEVEAFSEWLELYLLEQEENASDGDSVASEDVPNYDSDTNV